jgi:hypothetical protein
MSACERVDIPGFVPEFVSELMESGLSVNPREKPSFDDISEALNSNSEFTQITITSPKVGNLNSMKVVEKNITSFQIALDQSEAV